MTARNDKRPSAERTSVADLEFELAQIEQTLPPPARRVSRAPSTPRRSVPELMADLERLSADIPLRAPSAIPPRAASPPIPAPRTAPSNLPASDDYEDVPAVLGLLGEDGEPRPAIAPPPPVRRPTMPPPVPDAARRASIPAPVAPVPAIAAVADDSTMMMQLDGGLLEELDDDAMVELDDESMAEPAAMADPEGPSHLASVPRLPSNPGVPRDTLDALPDLADLELGAMLEPSIEPAAPAASDSDRDDS